jgi:uncharacterized membrane protein YvlD (DUF360 family)
MIRLGSILGRYLLVWLVYVLGLLLVAALIPGVRLETGQPGWWLTLVLLPVELAVLGIVLRPLLLFLTLPLNIVTMGLPTLFFNGLLLYLAARVQPSFHIHGYLDALLASLVLTAVAAPVVSLLELDEAYPTFQVWLYRLARRWGPPAANGRRRGLLILQIDGLSYRDLVRVLQTGRLPTLSAMLARRTHHLHRWFCGLPSNTPAVQAGLFYGRRFDVPGYRWFDRATQTLRVVSNPADARQLEERAAAGAPGLLAGGTSVNSLFGGGAAKRLLTVTALGAGAHDSGVARKDLNLFFLSPNAYTKAVLSAGWDFLSGFALGVASVVRRRRPRLRHHPIKMAQGAAFFGFLRSVSHYLLKQEVVRGVPVVYSNYVSYDDVAHVTATDSHAAMATLAAFDRNLRQLRRFARRQGALDYELMVMSDHGQTPSVPFRLRYGRTFGEVLQELAGRAVTETATGADEVVYLENLLHELADDRPRARLAARRGQRAMAHLDTRRLAALEPPRAEASRREPAPTAALAVCVSGCLAHVYVRGEPEALDLEEVLVRLPGLVAGLVAHPGVGFVAAPRAFGDAVAIGPAGVRNLITGRVVGEADPLAPFGDVRALATELAQLLSYPSSGDLVVNGAWLPETRQVVVFEEQLSSHGGLGGPQTEPFVILPASWRTRPGDLRSPEDLHRHVARNLRWFGTGKSG